jgi:hypothetical protein
LNEPRDDVSRNHDPNQEKAEYMGLCNKGDQHGSVIYSTGGANEFYPTWHLKLPAEKEELVARIKATAHDKACVYNL